MTNQKNNLLLKISAVLVFLLICSTLIIIVLLKKPDYTVQFYTNGGTSIEDLTDLKTLNELVPPQKTGYTFSGWYNNSEFLGQEVNSIPENLTGVYLLYAKWTINKYRITFNSNGGNEVDSLTFNYNSKISAPANPTKSESVFDGWYSDISLQNEYTFSNMPAEDIVLYAKWSTSNTQNEYTITFISDDIEVYKITQAYGTIITQPQALTKENYDFNGWWDLDNLLSMEPYVFSTMPNQNLTLHASWRPIEFYINFETNGGNVFDSVLCPYSIILNNYIPIPLREGFTFLGWYYDIEFQNELDRINNNFMPAHDITLYAKWYAIEYTIIYNPVMVFDNKNNPNFYSAESETFTLSDPERDGYEFGGWYYDSIFSLEAESTIVKGSYGELYLYIKWIEKLYSITFESSGGTDVETIFAAEGAQIHSMYTNPTKEGFSFNRWCIDEAMTTEYVFTVMPAESFTVYAEWMPE
jgi:uncharacterized repeat protein (TIGR02543 family)